MELLEKARKGYFDAISLAYQIVYANKECDAGYFLQSYAILRYWCKKLEGQCYQHERKVISDYLTIYEKKEFLKREEEIFLWTNSLKEREVPLSQNEKEAVSVLVEALVDRRLALIPDWQSWVPEL